MVVVYRQEHWREGEEPQPAVEQVVAAEKLWGPVRQLALSDEYDDAYEAELYFVHAMDRVELEGPLVLHAHRESKGVIIVRLSHGGRLLRRGHIGGVHQEPDAGPVFYGPHIHFPTTVFSVIDGRKARSRIYNWNVTDSLSLWDAMMAFAAQINPVGEPVQQQRRLHGG